MLTRDLRQPLAEPPAAEPLRWTRLAEPDVARVLAINPWMREAEMRRRLAEGQECLLAWIGDTLVHYRWETARAAYLPFLELTVRLEDGDCHVTDAFTHPAFRGRRLHSISAASAQRRAREHGVTRLIGVVAWINAPSLRVAERGGYVPVGTIARVKVGPWRHYVATGSLRVAAGVMTVGR